MREGSDHVDRLVDRLGSVDYFELLEIPRDAAPLAVQDAYYRALRRYHPDRHIAGGAERQRKLALVCARVGEAYRVLSDPTRRAEYLASLGAGMKRSRPGRRTTLGGRPDPRTEKGRSLLAGARELIAAGKISGARAKLELALQFEPESTALRQALEGLE